jgi:hypothetical protein
MVEVQEWPPEPEEKRGLADSVNTLRPAMEVVDRFIKGEKSLYQRNN